MRTPWLALACTALCSAAGAQDAAAPTQPSTKASAARFASLGPLAFGPSGVLFAADSKAAEIAALRVPASTAKGLAGDFALVGVDARCASALGVELEALRIVDLAIDPATQLAYLAVARGRGADAQPVLLRIDGSGAIEALDADALTIGRAALSDAPSDEPDARGRSSRQETITDLGFADGKVIVAGLSNAEFSSCLRTIPYPFAKAEPGAGIEIYHGAHGKLETRSPVRTFLAHQVGGEAHIVAAYTCTPLVLIPVKQLAPGARVRGKTIAELGNRNRPLDMIDYAKDGQPFFLMANSSRGVMKIPAHELEKWQGIEERVDGGGTQGLPYEKVADLEGVEQLDKLDATHGVVLVRGADGKLALRAIVLP
ncbi:MAG: hypothetical protein JNM84_24270 [Planctomycetes bacterium]|nr:hypothetical protein [Planctomycetota bacterium]